PRPDRRTPPPLPEACFLGPEPRPSALRSPAACARPLGGPRRPRPHAHALHLDHPRPAPPARLPRPRPHAEHFVHRVQRLPLTGRLRSVVAPLLALMRPLNGQLTYSA